MVLDVVDGSLQAEVRSIVLQGEADQVRLALRRHGRPDLLDQQPEVPLRAEASDLQPLIAAAVQEPLARLALADLRAALRCPRRHAVLRLPSRRERTPVVPA